MYKMLLRPDADGYSSADGRDWVHTELDGGIGRYRQDKIGASKKVGVQWTMNRSQYQYWRSFYHTVGSGTFLCDLVSEDGTGPVEHECNIIPGSVTLPRQVGFTYVQQCQLEVKPLPVDLEHDLEVMLIFETSGGDPDGWFDALEHLTLVTLPEAEGFDA